MQIILTLLLSICKKVSPSGKEHRQFNISDSTLKTELIINCIKKSPNPQTHHHALLLLSHLALMTPDQVLNDIIPIFTFVGNAIVRHDDSYSYQIIDKIIENIVPKLIKDNAGSDLKAVIPVLKIFTSIVLDVPEHRRLQLYKKLIVTLGAEKYLWPFIAVLLEGQVMIKKKQHQQQKQPHEDLPPRIYFALLLAKEFDLKTIISATNSMILYLKSLPMVIATQGSKCLNFLKINFTNKFTSTAVSTGVDNSIFCVKTHSNFHLRVYKYITTVFLKCLLESPEVIAKAESLKDSNEVDFKPLISNCLLFIPIVNKHHEASNQNEKMMALFLQHLFDVLEATIALLSPNLLLVFVEKLIEHESMHVRRKALEIFNWKLEKKFFDNCKEGDLLKLLTPLRNIYKDISKKNSIPIEEVVHQSALNSVRILSKKFSEEFSDEFVDVLRELTDLLSCENVKKDVLASLVNCIGELVFDLKVLAIEMLHKILTSFVNFLTVQDDHRSTFNLLFAVTSSLLKIIETVPLFLSPYLKQIIQQISRVSPALKLLQDYKIKDTLEKISKIWTTLAQLVPLRVLLPTVRFERIFYSI
jgi:U3 small nucleolar RNA-associated protein 10